MCVYMFGLFILVVVVAVVCVDVCVCVWDGERECIYIYIRHGNCLQKCEFLLHWNWLSAEKNNCPCGKEISSTKRKKEAPVLVPHWIPRETYRTCSHTAVTHLGHIIVNTVTHCYSHGLATGLNAVILTRLCAVFRLRKSECYESFESESGGGGGGRFQSSFKSMCVCE